MKTILPSGSGAVDSVESGWEFYQSLTFLKNSIAPRKTTSSVTSPIFSPSTSVPSPSATVPSPSAAVPSPSAVVPSPSVEAEYSSSPSPSGQIFSPLSPPFFIEDPTDAARSTPPSRKRKQDHLDDEFSSFLGKLENIVQKQCQVQVPTTNKNNHQSYFDVLGQKLDELPYDDQEQMKIQFLNMLHNKIMENKKNKN